MLVAVTYNGTLLTRNFLVSDINRPFPEFRAESTLVDGADGETFDRLTYGVRECSFTISSTGKEKKRVQDDARTLMSVFAVRRPAVLMFSDEKDRDGNQLRRYAVPTGTFSVEEFAIAGRWTCTFRQVDPFLYGKARSVVLKPNAAQQVSTGGNVESWPTSVAKVSGGTYTLSGGGRQIRFSSAGNRTLTLDHSAQTARLSPADSNAGGLLMGSRFFPMSGTMTLKANMQTTVSWTERWL